MKNLLVILFAAWISACNNTQSSPTSAVEKVKNERFVLVSFIHADTSLKNAFGDTLRTDEHHWYIQVRATDQIIPVDRFSGSSFEEKLGSLRSMGNFSVDTIEYKKSSMVVYGIRGFKNTDINVW